MSEIKIDDIDGRMRQSLKLPDPSPLVRSSLYVPGHMRLRGDDMQYRHDGGKVIKHLDRKEVRREVFGAFLALFDKPAASILEYAKTWGVLGICEHGYPVAHSATQESPLQWRGCHPKTCGDWRCEALERWRYYSRLMSSIVALRAQLSKIALTRGAVRKVTGLDLQYSPEKILKVSPGFPGDPEYWKVVFPETELGGFASTNKVTGARYIISFAVNRLLELANIVPMMHWEQDGLGFRLIPRTGQSGLFPRLAVQLMLTVTGAPDYSVCHKCHKGILLRRGQSIERRSFCRDCGPKAAQNEANKRHYQRRRAGLSGEVLPRRRLTASDKKRILSVLRRRGTQAVKELAQQYGVTDWAIYKFAERHSNELKGSN